MVVKTNQLNDNTGTFKSTTWATVLRLFRQFTFSLFQKLAFALHTHTYTAMPSYLTSRLQLMRASSKLFIRECEDPYQQCLRQLVECFLLQVTCGVVVELIKRLLLQVTCGTKVWNENGNESMSVGEKIDKTSILSPSQPTTCSLTNRSDWIVNCTGISLSTYFRGATEANL